MNTRGMRICGEASTGGVGSDKLILFKPLQNQMPADVARHLDRFLNIRGQANLLELPVDDRR